ncbi:MAG TPA: bifunctional aldolase/short-chain dehydrogenase, partial [Vicinamibacterales bacterium]|nr:bifunctional aldolase/short-chain dehydrogenase [Vicinamibacterales bacterium]
DAARCVDQYAEAWGEPLALRTYTSRLLGADPALVLHGGGNTSVKAPWRTVLGEDAAAVFVKASGLALAGIEPAGHPALDLGALQRLRALEALAEDAMVNELRRARFDAGAPVPSVETLLHAFLPGAFIDHTHADAVLALTNQRDGAALAQEAFGSAAALVPYAAPGFDLARSAAEAAERGAPALVLMKHGLVTWAPTAREAYERHIDLVARAEAFAAARGRRGTVVTVPAGAFGEAVRRFEAAAPVLRGRLAHATGDADRPWDRVLLQPLITEPVLALLATPGARDLLVTPPLTPDYLIRTKALPLWIGDPAWDDLARFSAQCGEAIRAYSAEYEAYVGRHRADLEDGLAAFDPRPRVVLVPGLGAVCAGPTARDAAMARDITAMTLQVKADVARMGAYEGLGERELFLQEYRGVQRAKLRAPDGPLADRVAVVTGAAGAIGAGIAEGLLRAGCHVVLTDLPGAPLDSLAAELDARFPGRAVGAPMDVTEQASVAEGFRFAARTWGGVDLVIVNAGVAHVSALSAMDLEAFRRVERVNVEGALLVVSESGRHFALQGTGGDIVLVSTKNVFAPGAKFGAYSATKAAAHQLARIASLELADIDVRVNMVAPDAVFSHGPRRSGLWAAVGPDRMKARGLDEAGLEEYYRSRNLLKARVTARHVANAVLYFATRQSPTTGATIPVDGGLPDATPR